MSTAVSDQYADELPGAPSDEVPQILANGRSDVSTLFLSMAARHPEGADADYLRWHTLDHRPEQHRLQSVRASIRAVSTPGCRAARAAGDADMDAVDHLMIYFFTGPAGLDEFAALSTALRDAGRSPFILPPVQRGVYTVTDRVASPRAKIGADVLPWLPVTGLYLLLEQTHSPPPDLAGLPGIAGTWSADSVATGFSSAVAGQQLTLCFIDGDPVETARSLQPALARRWADGAVKPLLAAPFYAVVPYQWDRHLP